jgi:hypothetical protein
MSFKKGNIVARLLPGKTRVIAHLSPEAWPYTLSS